MSVPRVRFMKTDTSGWVRNTKAGRASLGTRLSFCKRAGADELLELSVSERCDVVGGELGVVAATSVDDATGLVVLRVYEFGAEGDAAVMFRCGRSVDRERVGRADAGAHSVHFEVRFWRGSHDETPCDGRRSASTPAMHTLIHHTARCCPACGGRTRNCTGAPRRASPSFGLELLGVAVHRVGRPPHAGQHRESASTAT